MLDSNEIEYLRPWKLITLACGVALLIVGACYYRFADWDIGVSVLMAFITYFTAPWSLRVVWKLHWKWWPLAAFYCWLSVDGSYWAWHTFMGNEMLRADQWSTSLCLWLICGVLWLPKMSLSELLRAPKSIMPKHNAIESLAQMNTKLEALPK